MGWRVSVLKETAAQQLLSSALSSSLFGSAIFQSQIYMLLSRCLMLESPLQNQVQSSFYDLEPPELCKQQTSFLYKVSLHQIFKYNNKNNSRETKYYH